MKKFIIFISVSKPFSYESISEQISVLTKWKKNTTTKELIKTFFLNKERHEEGFIAFYRYSFLFNDPRQKKPNGMSE